MTQVYKSHPRETAIVGRVSRERPKMGALDLPFRCFEKGLIEILDFTESERTTLEADILWVRQ